MKAHLRASLHECTGTVKDTDTNTDKAEDTNTHTDTHRHTLLWRKRRVGPVWKTLACWRGAKLDCIQLSSTSPRTRQVVIVAPFVPRLKSRFTRVMVISIWIQACLHRLSSRDRVRAGHQRALGDVTRGATQSVLFACSSRAGYPAEEVLQIGQRHVCGFLWRNSLAHLCMPLHVEVGLAAFVALAAEPETVLALAVLLVHRREFHGVQHGGRPFLERLA